VKRVNESSTEALYNVAVDCSTYCPDRRARIITIINFTFMVTMRMHSGYITINTCQINVKDTLCKTLI